MRLRTPAALLATAVLAVGLGSITTASAAQSASAGGEVTACVNKKTRYARIVNASTTCRTIEFKTSWGGQGQTTVSGPGPQGERGRDGKDGKDGIGTQGPRGLQGLPGKTGPQGPAGPAGKDGEDGAPGQDGADGQDATAIKYQTFDLKIFGIPGVKGQITCQNVSKNPAVLEWANCSKGAPPAQPTPSGTPAPTPTGKSTYTPDALPSPAPTK